MKKYCFHLKPNEKVMKKRLLFISMPIIAVLVLLAAYLHGIVLLYSFPDIQDGFADVTEIGADRYRGAILMGDWIGQWGVLTPPEEAATGASVPLRGGWRELSGTEAGFPVCAVPVICVDGLSHSIRPTMISKYVFIFPIIKT
jgi:hypothetical protein